MRVAVALITDLNQRVLITRRPLEVSHGGQWEFPGGKLEAGESPYEALIREVKEEVGLQVIQCRFLGEVHHAYAQQHVSLLIYHVFHYQGIAKRCESQMDLSWVEVSALHQYTFPAANEEIIRWAAEVTAS